MDTDEPPPDLTEWELERWHEALIYNEMMDADYHDHQWVSAETILPLFKCGLCGVMEWEWRRDRGKSE